MVKRCRYDVEEGELEEKVYRKPYKCEGCKMKGIGKGCRCKECDYVLHMECMYSSHIFTPSLFPSSHIFKFSDTPPPTTCKRRRCTVDHTRYCDACGNKIEGFVYHCSDTQADLHPCCANLESKFVIDEYSVEFWLKKNTRPTKCDWCSSKVVKGGDKDIPGWVYEDVNGDYNFHVLCLMDIAIKSCEIAQKHDGNFGLALETELKCMSKFSKNKKRGRDGKSVGLEILKIVITNVLSMVLGDPTRVVAQLIVEGGIKLLDYLHQLLSN